MDVIARLPDGQVVDAVSAYTQVKLEGAPRLLKIPKSECPDVWIRLPQHIRPKSWESIGDPVVHHELFPFLFQVAEVRRTVPVVLLTYIFFMLDRIYDVHGHSFVVVTHVLVAAYLTDRFWNGFQKHARDNRLPCRFSPPVTTTEVWVKFRGLLLFHGLTITEVFIFVFFFIFELICVVTGARPMHH